MVWGESGGDEVDGVQDAAGRSRKRRQSLEGDEPLAKQGTTLPRVPQVVDRLTVRFPGLNSLCQSAQNAPHPVRTTTLSTPPPPPPSLPLPAPPRSTHTQHLRIAPWNKTRRAQADGALPSVSVTRATSRTSQKVGPSPRIQHQMPYRPRHHTPQRTSSRPSSLILQATTLRQETKAGASSCSSAMRWCVQRPSDARRPRSHDVSHHYRKRDANTSSTPSSSHTNPSSTTSSRSRLRRRSTRSSGADGRTLRISCCPLMVRASTSTAPSVYSTEHAWCR